MARTVEDCELMLSAVAGPHPSDPYSLLSFEAKNKKANHLKIEWRPLLGNTLLDDEVREQCEAALAVLREAGAEVRTVDEPFENAEAPWRVLQQSNWAARFYARLAEVEPKIEPGFAEGIRAGNLYINRGTTGAVVLRQPFGGFGKSAIGPGLKAGGPNYVVPLMRFRETGRPPASPAAGSSSGCGGSCRDCECGLCRRCTDSSP